MVLRCLTTRTGTRLTSQRAGEVGTWQIAHPAEWELCRTIVQGDYDAFGELGAVRQNHFSESENCRSRSLVRHC
jgi:hypothetical protein